MKKLPGWLIYIAAIGAGFFSFVIVTGILPTLFGPRFADASWVLFLAALVGLAVAYFTFKYSRLFMFRHISRAVAERAAAGGENMDAGKARNKRLALTIFFCGMVFFLIFIFALLSSIINYI